MVKVITVATSKQFYYPYLEETCRMFGGDLVCLGYGEEWGGYSWKFTKVIEYLSSIDPDEFVIFVDGYDVICVQDLSTIQEKYEARQDETNCKLIIATEAQGAVPKKMVKLYFGAKNGISINSGTYMGFAGDILDILTSAINFYPEDKDDQILITKYAKISGNEIIVDADSTFFYTVGTPFHEIAIPKNKNPYFVHACGCGLMTNILNNMGLAVTGNIKREFYLLFIKKCAYHLLEIIKRTAIFILLVIIIIMGIRTMRRRLIS